MVQVIRGTLVVAALVVAGCKKQDEPRPQPQPQPPPTTITVASDAAVVATASPRWYRATVRAPDGVEAVFFLGVPAGEGTATIATGSQRIETAATFDGTRLAIPIAVHMTAVEATVEPDGRLVGTFAMRWGAVAPSSIELVATPVAAPTLDALATVPGSAPVVDLGAPRVVYRLQMEEAGVAKLVVEQRAPGAFEATLFFDTGNTIALAGNGRGAQIVLTGFDTTSGYRVELALEGDRAKGSFAAGPRFDWRETFTAQQVPDFAFAPKPKLKQPGTKIVLPAELAHLRGPMLVEIGGSWCIACREAAPLLRTLHREYGARGLEVVTLLYELTDDPVSDARQVEIFKATYEATWPVVAVTGDIEDLERTLPVALDGAGMSSFPIMLFVRHDGTVVDVHAGFPAAHMTEEVANVKRSFRARIEQLLAK